MKKFFPVFLLALFCAATTRGTAEPSRADLVSEVESCEAILQDFMFHPAIAIPHAVWQQAHAVLIVNQFKAGFILGVKGGYGVIMVKKPGGRWSLPVLVSANETSLGFQIGARSVETVYIITDDQTPRMLFHHRFNIGIDARAEIGPRTADAQKDDHPLLSAPVLVYTKSSGLFAGATVKAAEISRNDPANFILYGTNYRLPELLYSDWVQPPQEVQPLMNYVERLAP
jgi:lipid-binding SYLF domain-containing protein